MRRTCISMSLCPTQVYKGVKTLDRSLVLHEKTAKMTSEGARPLQLSNCKNNYKLETRNKIETVVASRVLMNMELVEMENANQLCFFALGDSSSSSSSPSVNQRREWCLLVCLKEQASTKIHFRAKIFRGKTSYSEAEKQNKENTKAQHQALSYRGFTATKPYVQDSYARWLLRQRKARCC